MNIEAKFAKAILKKNQDSIVILEGGLDKKLPSDLKDNPNAYLWDDIKKNLDAEIAIAQDAGLTYNANQLKYIKSELTEVVTKGAPVDLKLAEAAMEVSSDAEELIMKMYNARGAVIGTGHFTKISRIMSDYLADMAPVTQNFIEFWKDTARGYVPAAQSIDIPWVTFDGKQLTQRYRPKVEERIDFTDPITGAKVGNIVSRTVDDQYMKGKGTIGDAVTGLGVNGNHMNDAAIVRQYWLAGERTNKRIATVHDGFFHPIGETNWTKDTLLREYAKATESQTIQKTLKAMRDNALANVNRKSRIAQQERVDNYIKLFENNNWTTNDLNNAMASLPELDDFLLAAVRKKYPEIDTRARMSSAIGTTYKRAALEEILEDLGDGRYSVAKLNRAFKDLPAYADDLAKRLSTSRRVYSDESIKNEFVKLANERQLRRLKERYDNGTLSEFGFFKAMEKFDFKKITVEQVINKGKVSKLTGKSLERIQKKEIQQGILAHKYNIKSSDALKKKIRSGDFSIDDFLNTELQNNIADLDLDVFKVATREFANSKVGGIPPEVIADSLKSYRRRLFFLQGVQRRKIREWYKGALEDARRRQLIDKDKTNKIQLEKLARTKKAVSKVNRLENALPEIYKEWSDDLERYFGITSLAELNIAYKQRAWRGKDFNIALFLKQTEDRYRAMTSYDILRPLKEGEDRYGIGP